MFCSFSQGLTNAVPDSPLKPFWGYTIQNKFFAKICLDTHIHKWRKGMEHDRHPPVELYLSRLCFTSWLGVWRVFNLFLAEVSTLLLWGSHLSVRYLKRRKSAKRVRWSPSFSTFHVAYPSAFWVLHKWVRGHSSIVNLPPPRTGTLTREGA